MKYSLLEKISVVAKSPFEMLSSAQQGHPGSVMSQVEILITLFYGDVIRFQRERLFQTTNYELQILIKRIDLRRSILL